MAVSVPAVGDSATAAYADAVANALNVQVLGDTGTVSAGAPTLSTTSAFAGQATVTFTLAVQTRVRVDVIAQFQGTGTQGRFLVRPGYNTGSSAVIGSVVQIGFFGSVQTGSVSGGGGDSTSASFGTVLLAPGTYTAYPVVQRASGGTATDVCQSSMTLVTAVGFS